MSAPRWILFDAVGTLLYPDPPVAETYCAAARQFGSRLTPDEIRPRFREAFAFEQQAGATSESRERERWRRIVGRVIDDVEQSKGIDLFEQLWRHFAEPQHWRLFDDVPAALAGLSNCGCRLGIASNFDSRLRAIVSGHPPLAACEAIFVSSEVGYAKPDSRFFAAVATQLEVTPDHVLIVGDDEANDVRAAKTVGWQAVLLNRHDSAPRGSEIQSLAELAAIVSPLRG